MKKIFMIFLGMLLFMGQISVFAENALTSPAGANKDAVQHNDDGISHFKEGHWKSAQKHFQESVKADPNFAEGHYNLGLSYHNAGMHKEAGEAFQKAVELAPNNKDIQGSEVLKGHLNKLGK